MKNRVLIAATVLPGVLFAHAGHGPIENGLAHYIFSPIHIIGVLAVATVVFAIYKYSVRKNRNA